MPNFNTHLFVSSHQGRVGVVGPVGIIGPSGSTVCINNRTISVLLKFVLHHLTKLFLLSQGPRGQKGSSGEIVSVLTFPVLLHHD